MFNRPTNHPTNQSTNQIHTAHNSLSLSFTVCFLEKNSFAVHDPIQERERERVPRTRARVFARATCVYTKSPHQKGLSGNCHRSYAIKSSSGLSAYCRVPTSHFSLPLSSLFYIDMCA